MTVFGQELFRRSRFKFWALAPFVVFGMAAILEPSGPWDALHVQAVILCETAGVLLLLSLWPYHDVPFVRRALAGLVFAVFLVHALDAVWWNALRRTGRSDPVEALLGFFLAGVPCALYALRGRFTWRMKPVAIDPDDPLLVQASAAARARLPQLVEQWRSAAAALVRFPFRSHEGDDGEEPLIEHLWGEVLALERGRARVRVLTPPQWGSLESDTLEVPLDALTDWELEHHDGTLEGGFTSHAMVAVAARDGWELPGEVRKRLRRAREPAA